MNAQDEMKLRKKRTHGSDKYRAHVILNTKVLDALVAEHILSKDENGRYHGVSNAIERALWIMMVYDKFTFVNETLEVLKSEDNSRRRRLEDTVRGWLDGTED
jgi:hypothetical protein